MANPLMRYREAQRRARALFEPFTRVHCAGCATPCCRKPARIRPVDLILVEELGFSVQARGTETASLLGAATAAELGEQGEPCDYLREAGCAFPSDLRPVGCTAFICEPMRRVLSPEEMERVEAAVCELEAADTVLMAALHQERG